MSGISFIDTHAHLDGNEYEADLDAVIDRARSAGVAAILIPAIDLPSVDSVLAVCLRYAGYAYPMIGLHPEEVKADYADVLSRMKKMLDGDRGGERFFAAVGEVGLDFYWSREFEKEQIEAFEEQVGWSVETRLPLMIHCRKAQAEMLKVLRRYERDLPGGVFHCFTGNEHEAAELLRFERFVLGIGGVLTFKKSRLPEVLPAAVPLERIVIETDSPYMAPVPMRGKRNESAYARYVVTKLAECYGVDEERVAAATTANARRIFVTLR